MTPPAPQALSFGESQGLMTLADFTRAAIGVPFREKGRDRDGWDCWGLVVCAFRAVRGVPLPGYADSYDGVRDADRLAKIVARETALGWQKVERPAPMDVAILLRRRRPSHCALVLDRRRMLHVEEGVATCIEPLSRWTIDGIWRPAAVMASLPRIA